MCGSRNGGGRGTGTTRRESGLNASPESSADAASASAAAHRAVQQNAEVLLSNFATVAKVDPNNVELAAISTAHADLLQRATTLSQTAVPQTGAAAAAAAAAATASATPTSNGAGGGEHVHAVVARDESVAKRSGLTKEMQTAVGRMCKRLIDVGRLKYLEKNG